MPVISKISIQKNNKERYNVFFDKNGEDEYAFSVSEDVLIKYQLKKGQEIDELELTEILFNEDIQKAFGLAINYLSYRMRSEKEVRKYLAEKEYVEIIIQEVIHKLKDRKYINDEAFCDAYVKTCINTTDKGPSVIRNELIEKGVDLKIIDEVLEQFSSEVQLEKAIKLCGKYRTKKKGSSITQLKNDLNAMLLRKGYKGSIVNQAIAITLENSGEDEEWEALVIQGEKAWRKHSKLPEDTMHLKIKQFLYRKGFKLDLIDKFIAEKKAEQQF